MLLMRWGGAEVNADGTITAPTYTIANADYDNVGDALNAIDTTLDDALLWDAGAGENGAFSAAHGKDKTASVITNVANGAISATSSDAINGSQLYTTNKYIADALGGDAEVNADGTITAPTYTIANAEYNNVGGIRMRLMITPCCGMRLPMAVLEPTMPAMTVKPASSLMSLMAVLVRTVPMQ